MVVAITAGRILIGWYGIPWLAYGYGYYGGGRGWLYRNAVATGSA
jgi:hypothetical protein